MDIYKDAPNGILTDCLGPDFLLTTDSGIIGIELTEVFQDTATSPNFSEMKRDAVTQIEFEDLLVKKLSLKLKFSFSLTVKLSKKHFLIKSKKELIADRIADFCEKEFRNLQLHDGYTVDNIGIDFEKESDAELIKHMRDLGYRFFEQEIKSITVHRWPNNISSFANHFRGGGVKKMQLEDIQPRLEDKENKLNNYQICSEYWLLILEGDYYHGTFANYINIKTPIASRYNKVFIYRQFHGKIVVLK